LIYLDSGPEFEAAVAAKPLPPRDMSDVPALPNPAPSPEQTARAELAAALGLTDAQLSAIIAAAT
jgi:hypothetical protein